jgi:hypothetical protein
VIPSDFIIEWRARTRWASDAQVEQDLVLSRALTEIFQDEQLARELALRGGTALHKLYFSPARRYSEGIDLVQLQPGPIGATIGFELRPRPLLARTPSSSPYLSFRCLPYTVLQSSGNALLNCDPDLAVEGLSSESAAIQQSQVAFAAFSAQCAHGGSSSLKVQVDGRRSSWLRRSVPGG